MEIGMAMSAEDVMTQLDRAAEICEEHGVRFTTLRREVLSLVLMADGPVGAYDLLDRLNETRKAGAPPTIYRTLDFLRAQGLIHRVDRLSAFIPCSDAGRLAHPVQFLICRRCGAVDELDDQEIVLAIKQGAAGKGFHPVLTTLDVEGTCSKCSLRSFEADRPRSAPPPKNRTHMPA
jgi:Fur family transcriptional regulator, zinc uptake regulator